MPYAALNSDPEVMKHFPSVQSRAESDNFIDRRKREIDAQGYGFFALELKSTGEFIGFTGLTTANFDAPFLPAIEVGWRLARTHWGNGYATEAAKACLIFARDVLEQEEVVSFTAASNKPSMAVMERIGMSRDLKGDFFHPKIDTSHPTARHVLYRIDLRNS